MNICMEEKKINRQFVYNVYIIENMHTDCRFSYVLTLYPCAYNQYKPRFTCLNFHRLCPTQSTMLPASASFSLPIHENLSCVYGSSNYYGLYWLIILSGCRDKLYITRISIGDVTIRRTSRICTIRIAGIPYRKYQCLVL